MYKCKYGSKGCERLHNEAGVPVKKVGYGSCTCGCHPSPQFWCPFCGEWTSNVYGVVRGKSSHNIHAACKGRVGDLED